MKALGLPMVCREPARCGCIPHSLAELNHTEPDNYIPCTSTSAAGSVPTPAKNTRRLKYLGRDGCFATTLLNTGLVAISKPNPGLLDGPLHELESLGRNWRDIIGSLHPLGRGEADP